MTVRTGRAAATVATLVLLALGAATGQAAAEPTVGPAPATVGVPAAAPDPDDEAEPEPEDTEPQDAVEQPPAADPAPPEQPAEQPAPPPAPAPAGEAPEQAPQVTTSDPIEIDPELGGARRPYPGSPEEEAARVADEDDRLNEVRTLGSVARWTGDQLKNPYRLLTGSSYTLTLTSRRNAYTLTDLLALAPQTFVRQADGSYLLSEHIVVQSGATLQLNAPGGLELRMASDADAFVSIVSYGGRLEIIGTQGNPVRITSWDRQAGTPDTNTTDGRAYLRAIGGQVGMQYVRLDQLGFWSGRTGGLALTGTDRPTPGALDAIGDTLTNDEERDAAEQRNAGVEGDNTGGVSLDQPLPAGELPLPQYDVDEPQYSYVSVSLLDVVTEGNAFGTFIAGANGVDIRGGGFNNSLVDGLTLHRFVTNAVIEGAAAKGNGGDGIRLARATTGTVLSEVDASSNARNGISISGLPLASGPTAIGISVGDYGGNAVSNSRVADNGRYGIEVIGGHDIGVNANDLTGNDMAIVVRTGARAVAVVGNNVAEPNRQGIAVRDGVHESTVSGNIVDGGETAIHVRASSVEVVRNTLTDASVHGISLVGNVEGTSLQENTISGRGPSAIDMVRAESVNARDFDNETSGWSDTTPWLVTLKRIAQPLNLLWTGLGLIVVITAVRGIQRKAAGKKQHPYADKQRVATVEDIVVSTPARQR